MALNIFQTNTAKHVNDFDGPQIMHHIGYLFKEEVETVFLTQALHNQHVWIGLEYLKAHRNTIPPASQNWVENEFKFTKSSPEVQIIFEW